MAVALFSSCGIENYLYLDPVANADWQPTNSLINFMTPDQEPAIDDSVIGYKVSLFYKIYADDNQIFTELIPANYESICKKLKSDYDALAVLSQSSSANTVRDQIKFKIGARELSIVDSAGVEQFLTAQGASIRLSVATINAPLTLSVNGGVPMECRRDWSNETQLRFVFDPSWYPPTSEAAANDPTLADYAVDLNSDTPKSAYVMLFALASGISDTDFMDITSKPTFLGIIQLGSVIE